MVGRRSGSRAREQRRSTSSMMKLEQPRSTRGFALLAVSVAACQLSLRSASRCRIGIGIAVAVCLGTRRRRRRMGRRRGSATRLRRSNRLSSAAVRVCASHGRRRLNPNSNPNMNSDPHSISKLKCNSLVAAQSTQNGARRTLVSICDSSSYVYVESGTFFFLQGLEWQPVCIFFNCTIMFGIILFAKYTKFQRNSFCWYCTEAIL